MPDGSTTPLTDAALPPDPGVPTIASRSAINGSIPAGFDSPSRLGIPHAPPEIADRLLAEGAVIRRAARATLVAERQIALGPVFHADVGGAAHGCDVRNEWPLREGVGPGERVPARCSRCLRPASWPRRPVSVRSRSPRSNSIPRSDRSWSGARGPFAGRARACQVPCDIELRQEDFVEWGTRAELGDLFSEPRRFDAAILNPPYKKLNSGSDLRRRLDRLGIAAPNLYAAFLGLAVGAVRPGGVVVAIVPRELLQRHLFQAVSPLPAGFRHD